MMDEPEEGTLLLRLNTQDLRDVDTACSPTPIQDQVPVTQTSCISTLESQCTQSQITQANDPLSQYSSTKNGTRREVTHDNGERSHADTPDSQDSQPSSLKDRLPPQTKLNDEGGHKPIDDESVAADKSSECPNDAYDLVCDDFEVKEMDRSFLRAEPCDDDENVSEEPTADQIDPGSGVALQEKRDASGEQLEDDKREGNKYDEDFSESGDDQDDNEELKEAMADEGDGFHKGPEICLPYKEPEQLSLQEFLARRRSKRASASQQQTQQQSTCAESSQEDAGQDEPQGRLETTQNADSQPGQPKVEMSPVTEIPPPPSQRKSKLHEEILKAAAKVTPQLSRSDIIDTPVDELIQRAIVMNQATQGPAESTDATPGSQLKDLKARLKAKIIEQRRRIRMERASSTQNDDEPQDDEEEMTDDEDDDDDYEDDEDALLDRAAKESEGEDGEEASEDIAAGDNNVNGIDGVGALTESGEQGEDREYDEAEEEDSDIEDKRRKHRINVVQDSDDDEDLAGDSDAPEQNSPDAEWNLRLDEGEEYPMFMRISQTQKPKTQELRGGGVTKPRMLSTELFAEDLPAEASGTNVDDDLLAMCSGSFAAEKVDGSGDDDDAQEANDEAAGVEDNSADEAEGDDGDDADDDVGEEDPEGDNEDDELNEYRKSLRVERGCEDEPDNEGELEPAPRKVTDFFEGEAELSGSDVGSDDEDGDGMTEEEKRQLIKDLISENPGISDEQLQDQVKQLHFKYMHADDQRELRMYKEMLLADGDLHSDGPGRERRFRWTNLSTDFVGGNVDEGESDGDVDEETEEEAKWKARRLELEKQKREKLPFDSVDGRRSMGTESKAVQEIRLDEDTNISRVLRDANKSLKVAHTKRSHDILPAKRPVSGGFLNMTDSVLERIADKVKGSTAKEKEGSQTTKNFVFRAVEKKIEGGPSNANKRPSSEGPSATGPKTKKAKIDSGATRQSNRSIFNKF